MRECDVYSREITIWVDIPDTVVKYDFITANDMPMRDPVEWDVTWLGETHNVVFETNPGRRAAYNEPDHFDIHGRFIIEFEFVEVRNCETANSLHLSEIVFLNDAQEEVRALTCWIVLEEGGTINGEAKEGISNACDTVKSNFEMMKLGSNLNTIMTSRFVIWEFV